MIDCMRMHKNAKLPTRAYPSDAGLDLYLSEDTVFYPRRITKAKTGIAMRIPVGYVGIIKDKSGLADRDLAVRAGVVDEGYTGEIKVVVANYNETSLTFLAGDAIAQIMIIPCLHGDCRWTDHLGRTERGDGGFGSTTGRVALTKASPTWENSAHEINPGNWVKMRSCVDGLFSDCVGLVIGMYRAGNDVFARIRWNDRLACPKTVSVAIQNLELAPEPDVFQLDEVDDNGF